MKCYPAIGCGDVRGLLLSSRTFLRLKYLSWRSPASSTGTSSRQPKRNTHFSFLSTSGALSGGRAGDKTATGARKESTRISEVLESVVLVVLVTFLNQGPEIRH